jgi:ubiquinone/menaquinone biosynthesis C-methylase UbiE
VQKDGARLADLEFIKSSWDSEADYWSIYSKDYLVDFYKNVHDKDIDYFYLLFQNEQTKNGRALEYGCGWGRNIKNFSNKFKYIDGCDISKNQIQKAKGYLYNVENYSLFLTDGKTIEKSENYYDFAYSTLVLSYITSNYVRDCIFKEIYRVLKPAGKFALQMGVDPIISPELSEISSIYTYNQENLSDIFNRLDIEKEDNIKNTLSSIGFKNYSSRITDIKNDSHEGLSFKTQVGYDKFLWITIEK